MKTSLRDRQRGITLIVGLIFLVLITLMVTAAFTLNSTNLKSVGNMQFRNESIAAADKALEQVIGVSFPTGFVSVPATTQTLTLDINNDGTDDYTVSVAPPSCIQVTQLASTVSSGSCGGIRAGSLSGCTAPQWSSLWDVKATVTDTASGASVVVNEGFRVQLTDVQKSAVCP